MHAAVPLLLLPPHTSLLADGFNFKKKTLKCSALVRSFFSRSSFQHSLSL